MTAVGEQIARALADALGRARELEKTAPGDVDTIVGTLVAHLRGWRPESVAPLGVLPDPEAPICDPRGA